MTAQKVLWRDKVLCILVLCPALFLDQLCNTMLLPVLPIIVGSNLNRSMANETVEGDAGGTELTRFDLLGLIFGGKGVVQLICTPLIGVLIDYTRPLVSIVIGLLATSILIPCNVRA